MPFGNDTAGQRPSQPKQLRQDEEAEPSLLSLLQGHTQQPSPSGTGTYLDQDHDYCKTYAVLVDDLRQLLARLHAEPSSSELQLELQNQTRAAVSRSAFSSSIVTSRNKGCLLTSNARCSALNACGM